MHYLPLKQLLLFLPEGSDLGSLEGRAEAAAYFSSLTVSLAIGSFRVEPKEIAVFLISIDDEKMIYCEWIEQHPSLLSLLTGIVPREHFSDDTRLRDHRLFAGFQRFLSPYLRKSIMSLSEKGNISERATLLFYATLLTEEDRKATEQLVVAPLFELVRANKEKIASAATEDELLMLLETTCNEDVKAILSQLSRGSYFLRLEYVDQLLWCVKQKGCTPRLANWILKQVEGIELNPEHLASIQQLRTDLREGRLNIKGQIPSIRKRRWKQFAWIIGIVVVCLLTIWVVVLNPFKEKNDFTFERATSFEQFTKGERKRIDSLLRHMQHTSTPDDNTPDPNQQYPGNGMSISIRTPFENQNMEHLYRDFLLDADLADISQPDTCETFVPSVAFSKRYNGVQDLMAKKGESSIYLKNESGYDVYILVFQDQANGKIFSSLLSQGKGGKIQLDMNDQLIFIAGNELSPFRATNSTTEMPSKEFDHHFCETDFNYSSSIKTIYSLVRPQAGKNKILFSGARNDYFNVVDLYTILQIQ